MGRYFFDEGGSGEGRKEEVYNISDEVIKKTKIKQGFKPNKVTKNEYKKKKKKGKGKDPFPGKKPVDESVKEIYSRGENVDTQKIRTKFKQKEQSRREGRIDFAVEVSARTEQLLDDEHGWLEGDEDQEFTAQIKQTSIKRAVDEETKAKCFDLKLSEYGPYRTSYTRNGRYLLLGGRQGHLAAFDWARKQLLCEVNAGESVHDVQWLHTENMFAAAQKKWTYIYDNQGIEVHCIKSMDHIQRLEFLPYHFLLAGASERGGLSWLDVSVGKLVAETWTKLGNLSVMTQNPSSAVLMLGHSQGTVTMWTPSMKEPAGKVLAHRQPVRAIAVAREGLHMATAAQDRSLKVWDLRMLRPLHEYKIGGGAAELEFSQRGLLATSFGSRVEVYRDPVRESLGQPYMKHEVLKSVTSLSFCPYEDVLGIGHGGGFSSMLVPGAGEPNFDALEANPYQTVKQRKEAEVKALLDKIPAELISLDREALGGVDVPTMQQKIEERNSKLFVKPSNIEFDPRQKMKGKGGSAKRHHIRRTVVEQARKANLKGALGEQQERREGQEKKPAPVYKNVLDRFK